MPPPVPPAAPLKLRERFRALRNLRVLRALVGGGVLQACQCVKDFIRIHARIGRIVRKALWQGKAGF